MLTHRTKASVRVVRSDRYTRLYPPLRGLELDGETLEELAEVRVCLKRARVMPTSRQPPDDVAGSSAVAIQDDEYMENVRVRHQSVAERALLTLHHYGYGMEPLSTDQTRNPFDNTARTWLRVCAESFTFDAACRYFASGTRASLVLQHTPAHVDGVAHRKQRRQHCHVEQVTTRWAHAAHAWTDDERRAAMAHARSTQPLVAKSLWLRTSVALDITPCRGLALVAVSSLEPSLCSPNQPLLSLILLNYVHTVRAARTDRAPSRSTVSLCRSQTRRDAMWSAARSREPLRRVAAPTTALTTTSLSRRRVDVMRHSCERRQRAVTCCRLQLCARGRQLTGAAIGSRKRPTGLYPALRTREASPTRAGESRIS